MASEVARLARMIQELDDQLATCMRCGMCQAACPLYAETGREADVARGKLALLDGLSRSLLDDPNSVKERLDRCLLCGSCAAHCPSGVKVLDIFLKARAILAGYLGLPPLKRWILQNILAKPAWFDRLMDLAPSIQRLFSRPVNATLGTSCTRLKTPLGDRHFRDLAPIPFHRLVEVRKRTARPGEPRVAFFVGCLIDKFYPQVAQAAMRVLDRAPVGFSIPEGQACCGIPALSAGDSASFAALVEHNLTLFDPESLDVLITACATCTSTIRKLWPLMARELNLKGQDRILALAEKTRDIGQFLVEGGLVPSPGPGSESHRIPVTYHDPCHLKKSLGVFQEPRTLIEATPGVRLIEMTEPDRCCGMGGSFNLEHYELSQAIGQKKLEDIDRSGAAVVATGCPACMEQIGDLLSHADRDVQVKHFIELYAEGLERKPGPGEKILPLHP